MGFYVNPGGHAEGQKANIDSLSRLYIGITVAWTTLLAAGIAFLLVNKKIPFLRIRNLRLGIAAVCTLHVYWILAMLVYTMNGTWPCQVEYWVMSIYLPFGIALYQANSTVLQKVSIQQDKISRLQDVRVSMAPRPNVRGWRRFVANCQRMTITERAMYGIGMGMIAQFLIALVFFLISRKFHSGFGLVGSPVNSLECRRGWEWWPSIVWQFTWAWIYAPYLIYKIRREGNDFYSWRAQTVVCSLAGMPGSPMWLIALYAPAFSLIDKYWAASQWFVPGICVMEACVIFVPCWQVLRSHKLRKETLDILAEWESKTTKTKTSLDSGSTRPRSTKTGNSAGTRRSEVYTMQALETALVQNPSPLLHYASLKDFSGENISFLWHVRAWKDQWSPPTLNRFRKPNGPRPLEGEILRRRQFNIAVEIYSSFISMQYSSFPVNLSSAHYKELESMFDGPASTISAHVEENSAIPFAAYDAECAFEKDTTSILSSAVSSDDHSQSSVTTASNLALFRGLSLMTVGNRLPDDILIPESFGSGIFDNSEGSIKYMVLTNTWPKYVASGYSSSTQSKGFAENLKHRGAVNAFAHYIAKPFRSSEN